MCYDASQLALRIYRDAQRSGASPEELEELRRKWKILSEEHPPNLHHGSGYSHPELYAFHKNEEKLTVDRFIWGLIPHWVKDEEFARKIWNQTLNARSETMFEKPSFRDAAKKKRVIIPLEGFFEHHHKAGKSFPYFVENQGEENLLVGGIAAEWINPATREIINSLSIVTTKGNSFMAEIHNNPKMKEARMPLLLNDEHCSPWLEGEPSDLKDLLQPNSEIDLAAHTVRRIRGKEYIGNCPEATEAFEYEELMEPPTLF